MKKTAAKLVLNRETLRALTDTEQKQLGEVQGGGTVFTCAMLTSCNVCPLK